MHHHMLLILLHLNKLLILVRILVNLLLSWNKLSRTGLHGGTGLIRVDLESGRRLGHYRGHGLGNMRRRETCFGGETGSIYVWSPFL